MTNPRYYENIQLCDLCGKMVTSAQARITFTDEEGIFHCIHAACEPIIDLSPWP